MTQVDFHFNVASRTAYVCRLLRKVVYSGHRVLVLLPREELDALDGALWSFSQEDFIAHARCEAVRQVPHSAVVLCHDIQAATHFSWPPVMLNLLTEVPSCFQRFSRVLEVVSTADDDRALARQRWRTYAQHHIQPNRFDLSVQKSS